MGTCTGTPFDINLKVAREVMRYRYVESWHAFDRLSNDSLNASDIVVADRQFSHHEATNIRFFPHDNSGGAEFNPCNSLVDAFKVVKRLESETQWFALEHVTGGIWIAQFHHRTRTTIGRSGSPSVAICEAALEWRGGQ